MSGTAEAVLRPTVERLRDLVAAEGEAIAPALGETAGEDVLGPLVVAAASSRPDAAEYALVVESVLEGYLLHFGRPRLLDTADTDLRLLAGDYMYALGLSRLARLGDLAAVRALADLITLSARHHAAQPGDHRLLDDLWALGPVTRRRSPRPAGVSPHPPRCSPRSAAGPRTRVSSFRRSTP
jgi:hypothetical protein